MTAVKFSKTCKFLFSFIYSLETAIVVFILQGVLTIRTHKKVSKRTYTKFFACFFGFLRNIQKKFGFCTGFFRFLEEHTKFFCATRTYKRFLYVLIVNTPCRYFLKNYRPKISEKKNRLLVY